MVSLFKEELLGSILLKSQIITEQDIETALNEQKRTGQRIGEALVGLGIVMQEDIDWALSHQLDIPYVRVNTKTVDPAAVSLVPASLARRHKLIPLIRAGDELWVAIADPLDKEAVSEVGRLTGCDVSISMGLNREILEMQEHFYGYPEEAGTLGFSSTCMPPEDVEAINGDTTGGRLIDGLLTYMQVNGLSSL